MVTATGEILDELVTPLSDCFTPEVARQIVALRADETLQRKIHELGQKCSQGELSESERHDYETIVRFTRFVSVLQSKARKLLKTAP